MIQIQQGSKAKFSWDFLEKSFYSNSTFDINKKQTEMDLSLQSIRNNESELVSVELKEEEEEEEKTKTKKLVT